MYEGNHYNKDAAVWGRIDQDLAAAMPFLGPFHTADIANTVKALVNVYVLGDDLTAYEIGGAVYEAVDTAIQSGYEHDRARDVVMKIFSEYRVTLKVS